jgi:Tol biopolymer transport system component
MSFRSLCLRLVVNSLIFSGVAGAQPVVNGKIAFTSFRDNHSQIYLMDADGSNEVNICGTALFLSVYDIAPKWSPDGGKIAFVRTIKTINPTDSVYEIYSMNPDCSNVTQLTFDNAENFGPRWSPDGQRIAFYSTKGSNNFQIWVMNADGSGETRLTNNSFDDVSPSWSPDGTKIAFATNRDRNFEVYVMNADGSAQTNLTHNAAYDDYPPGHQMA